jgi:hypothetical protein
MGMLEEGRSSKLLGPGAGGAGHVAGHRPQIAACDRLDALPRHHDEYRALTVASLAKAFQGIREIAHETCPLPSVISNKTRLPAQRGCSSLAARLGKEIM